MAEAGDDDLVIGAGRRSPDQLSWPLHSATGLRQRRQVGEELRMLVDDALEDGVVVEVGRDERLVLLEQPRS